MATVRARLSYAILRPPDLRDRHTGSVDQSAQRRCNRGRFRPEKLQQPFLSSGQVALAAQVCDDPCGLAVGNLFAFIAQRQIVGIARCHIGLIGLAWRFENIERTRTRRLMQHPRPEAWQAFFFVKPFFEMQRLGVIGNVDTDAHEIVADCACEQFIERWIDS